VCGRLWPGQSRHGLFYSAVGSRGLHERGSAFNAHRWEASGARSVYAGAVAVRYGEEEKEKKV